MAESPAHSQREAAWHEPTGALQRVNEHEGNRDVGYNPQGFPKAFSPGPSPRLLKTQRCVHKRSLYNWKYFHSGESPEEYAVDFLPSDLSWGLCCSTHWTKDPGDETMTEGTKFDDETIQENKEKRMNRQKNLTIPSNRWENGRWNSMRITVGWITGKKYT